MLMKVKDRTELTSRLLWLALTTVTWTAVNAQEIRLTAQRDNIAKGELLELVLELNTGEHALDSLSVGFELPEGFAFDDKSAPRPEFPLSIPAGSSFRKLVKILAPKMGWGQAGSSTREPKVFVANVKYQEGADGPLRRRSATTTIRYTTAVASFYVSGMIGIVIGLLIKFFVKRKNQGFSGRARILAKEELPGAFTTILIGWVVLIILAKGGVPTQGWHDSLALGAALGLIGDENLLSKIAPSKST